MKILLIRNDNIGDLVCSTPAIEALRKKYPKAQIDIVVNSLNAPVVIGNPFLDKVWVYTKTKHTKNFFLKIKAFLHKGWILWRIFRESYDVSVILRVYYSKHAGLFARAARAKKCLGVKGKGSEKIPNFESCAIKHSHEVMVCFDILESLGVQYGGEKTYYPIKETCIRYFSKPYILFHISSRRIKDNPYPMEYLKEIIQAVFMDFIVIGDSGDKQRCEELVELENCHYIKTQSIDEVAILAKDAEVAIAFDGGVAHIFGACCKRVITIFDNVSLDRWHTWGHFEGCLQSESKRASDVKPREVVEKMNESLKN